MRLFVAIELADEVRKRLRHVQDTLKRPRDRIKWVRPELMHVTLKFLGEVTDADAVGDAVEAAASRTERFALAINGCGCFPVKGPVRAMWAGVTEPTGTLARCVEEIEAELETIGFPRERRPFSPHITLARVREDCSEGKLRTAVDTAKLGPLDQPVAGVVVMSSVLGSDGPAYSVVRRVSLGEPNPNPAKRC